MNDFIGQKTTINFDGDLKMDWYFKHYTNTDIFVIMKQCRGGKYLLQDSRGQISTLGKRNINFFKKSDK